jgi:hypothetical protein
MDPSYSILFDVENTFEYFFGKDTDTPAELVVPEYQRTRFGLYIHSPDIISENTDPFIRPKDVIKTPQTIINNIPFYAADLDYVFDIKRKIPTLGDNTANMRIVDEFGGTVYSFIKQTVPYAMNVTKRKESADLYMTDDPDFDKIFKRLNVGGDLILSFGQNTPLAFAYGYYLSRHFKGVAFLSPICVPKYKEMLYLGCKSYNGAFEPHNIYSIDSSVEYNNYIRKQFSMLEPPKSITENISKSDINRLLSTWGVDNSVYFFSTQNNKEFLDISEILELRDILENRYIATRDSQSDSLNYIDMFLENVPQTQNGVLGNGTFPRPKTLGYFSENESVANRVMVIFKQIFMKLYAGYVRANLTDAYTDNLKNLAYAVLYVGINYDTKVLTISHDIIDNEYIKYAMDARAKYYSSVVEI